VTRRRRGERDVGGGFGGGRGGLGGVETDATFVEEVFEGKEFRGVSEVGNDGVVFGMFFGEDEKWVATEITEVLEEVEDVGLLIFAYESERWSQSVTSEVGETIIVGKSVAISTIDRRD